MSREGPYPCLQDAIGWPVSLLSMFPLITCIVASMVKRQPLNLPLYSFLQVTISLLQGVNLVFVDTFTGGSMGQK